MAPPAGATWSTLRAEHRVALDVRLAKGKHERRTLRGAIAVARPDRFRLRALGPGGITLFDIIEVAGRVHVVESLRDATQGRWAEILRALAGDLSAAYQLSPAPPGRTVARQAAAQVIREPGRTVRLRDFERAGGHAVFRRAEIENSALGYTVSVEVVDVETQVALDPALFAAP